MRPLHLASGLLTLGVLWLGPLPRWAPESFSAHMVMHMGVVAVGAPLLALGIAGGKRDPVAIAPALFPPLIASLAELLVVWTWHAPKLHHFARHSGTGLVLEQGAFLLAGLWLWLSVLGGDSRSRASRAAAGIAALVLTSMHMTLLGALLALPSRPLYVRESEGLALHPLQDQHLGGAIMLLAGGVVYLAGGLALALRLLRAERSPA